LQQRKNSIVDQICCRFMASEQQQTGRNLHEAIATSLMGLCASARVLDR
jgi:hypothetical protein